MAVPLTRRGFIRGGLAAGATCMLPKSHVLGANDDIRVAILGCGVMGGGHINKFDAMSGVRVVAVSDADLTRMDSETKALSHLPDKHQDFRRILDDKGVDAVVIATHAQSLAQPHGNSGLPGRQTRLCAKTGFPQHLGRTQDGRGGAQI